MLYEIAILLVLFGCAFFDIKTKGKHIPVCLSLIMLILCFIRLIYPIPNYNDIVFNIIFAGLVFASSYSFMKAKLLGGSEVEILPMIAFLIPSEFMSFMAYSFLALAVNILIIFFKTGKLDGKEITFYPSLVIGIISIILVKIWI